MITDYVIITSHDVKLLQDEVKEQLENGWQPLGNPFVREAGGVQYSQAMVRETTP